MMLDNDSKVISVSPDSQAERGGVKGGERVVAVNGDPHSGSATSLLSTFPIGATVTFGFAPAGAGAEAGDELQLTGTMHKRSATSGFYKKVKVAIEGDTLCYADFKNDKPSVLRGADVERLEVANRATLEFVLLTKKSSPERGRTHGFRVSTRAEFARWMTGLQQWLDALPQAI